MVQVAMAQREPTTCVQIQIQGVPAFGILDVVPILQLQKVATVARLKNRDLKRPDKTPQNYDQISFKLDGRMDLDICFDNKTICTPVYIKMDRCS